MKAGKIIKRIFLGIIGLLVAAYALFWLYFTIFPAKPPDVFHGVAPDFGKGPDKKVMSHVQSSVMLGTTPYKAMVGTSRYDTNSSESWNYYFCWIDKRSDDQFGEAWSSFFTRWIPAKDVPAELWEKDVKEIVSYDPVARIVTFDCGTTNYICTLPPPD